VAFGLLRPTRGRPVRASVTAAPRKTVDSHGGKS